MDVVPLDGEQLACARKSTSAKVVVYSLFMSDSLYHYPQDILCFKAEWLLHRGVGGLNGVAHDSNSFFYMRGI